MIDSLKGSENLVQNKSKPLDGLPELNKDDGTFCRNQILALELSYIEGKTANAYRRSQDYKSVTLSLIYLELVNELIFKASNFPFLQVSNLNLLSFVMFRESTASSGKLNIPLIKRNLYSTGLTRASNQVSNWRDGSFWQQINGFVLLKQCQKICMRVVFFCGRYNEVNMENA